MTKRPIKRLVTSGRKRSYKSLKALGESLGKAYTRKKSPLKNSEPLSKKEKKKMEKEAKKIINSEAFKGLLKAGFSERKAFKIMRGY